MEMIENLKIENSTKMWVCAISPYERRFLDRVVVPLEASLIHPRRFDKFVLIVFETSNITGPFSGQPSLSQEKQRYVPAINIILFL